MRKRSVFGLLVGLLLAVLDFSLAEDIMAYFKVGGELELKPTFTGRISNILWKLNGDLVAEWVEDIVSLDYYGRFKERTTLDTTTGVLILKKLDTSDEGKYTVEINNKVHPQRFTGKAITVVPKPDVWVQPLKCNADMDSCSLKCEKEKAAIEDAGPIVYEWKEDNGKWQQKGMNITISKTADAHIKTFTCKMKNPVSEEESDPKENVFYKEPTPPDVGLAVGITIPVVAAFILGISGFVFRKKILACLPKRQNGEATRTVNGNTLSSPPDGDVNVPLKENSDLTTEARESA
ncbi:uncharacterized protein LOC141795030 [Halichoeres trimaculatus]|uniref:uncharacterized protein LOC141795030 n=1 Tax=Halichoeres trimaculatus TaxID=147232 RepID=UPI003D9FA34D